MQAEKHIRKTWIDRLLLGLITSIFTFAWGLVGISQSSLGLIAAAAVVAGLLSAPLLALVRMMRPSGEGGLVDRPATLARARALRATRGRRLGTALIALGVLSWPALVILLAATLTVFHSPMFIVPPLLISISATLSMRGRRMRAKDAARVLGRDPRPQIVYLRPFAVDRANRVTIDPDSFLGKTAEEKMAKDLRDIAPFVALGDPMDDLPELGAVRFYAEDGEWQEKVKDLTKRAGTIILCAAGKSASLAWEVQHLVSLGQPERIVLLKHRGYDVFYDAFAHLFPCGLLENSASVYLYFDAAWTPRSFDEHSRIFLPGSLDRQRDQVLRRLFTGRH